VNIINTLDRFAHRRCKSAMVRMRDDIKTVNAERAQMARQLVEARKYIDELTEQAQVREDAR